MESLKNKVAIITGGAGGIGIETAKLFIQEGAKVMLVDLDEDLLKAEIKKIGGPNIRYCVADVSKELDVSRYVSETLKEFQKIDIFFNNAGIEGVFKPIADYPEAVFDKIIAVNLKGVWLGCQKVIPKMENEGSVIITSSVAGLKGFAGLGAYVATKHAVIGIMRVAALEFADRKIRVNTVHPGPVNNRMMRSIEEQISPEDSKIAQENFEKTVPFKRYAESKEIGEMVLFLASDKSKYITGTKMIVDGGMTIV
ncbi:NAD(P)-dependent dehydrogenase (short-subunit alcohol dehydrogenase family) [Gillisia mitskevichiae]|uniref:NAD(P)-dependent dehydrogenase (Short-subunit alcohol dehydrogenase family) n=1 Tax=Gillisia mitskevichiae TaxID=270921 RepID=A0A495PT36_9FLAO|nr:SDR family oxidoreductase [Gillisia mitskevichiae]RKS53711.1 NAD(P)-dependent dehydrogenase (short-subunit alcohol dehydrogenase family) [Gillisia mitskevichiae]